MNSPRSLLVVGQTPPPVHGQALQIQRLVAHRFEGIQVDFIPMQFSQLADEIGKMRFRKVISLFKLIQNVRKYAKSSPHGALYFPPAPPLLFPILRDMALLFGIRRQFAVFIIALHSSGQRASFGRNRLTRCAARLVYGRPQLALLNTEDSIPDAEALNAQEIQIVPIGIPDPGEPPTHVKNGNCAIQLLSVGHISTEKGSLDLLEALSALRRDGVDATLTFVGPFGSSLSQSTFHSHASAVGVADFIKTPGTLEGDDLASMYRTADIFVFPTKAVYESLGLAAIEAMSHGLPVVASRWRGLKFVVLDEVTGLLCEAGNVLQLSHALGRLSRNPEEAQRFGAAGRKRFLCQFTEDLYWPRLEGALKGALLNMP